MLIVANQWQNIATKNKKKLTQLPKRVTLQMARKIIRRSPVDSGLFKETWQTAIGSPNLSIDPSISGAGLVPTVKGWRLGETLFFTNNQPYALVLEFGHSDFAPQGMVRLTIAEFQSIVATEIKFIANPVNQS